MGACTTVVHRVPLLALALALRLHQPWRLSIGCQLHLTAPGSLSWPCTIKGFLHSQRPPQ